MKKSILKSLTLAVFFAAFIVVGGAQAQAQGAMSPEYIRQATYGTNGSHINAIQGVLISKGYMTGSATGYFGPITRAAVKSFQAANGLPTVGNVGPLTAALLRAQAGVGSTSVVATTPGTSCGPATAPWIQVLSPNGGEVYMAGQEIQVRWSSCNIPTNASVSITLESSFKAAYGLLNVSGTATLNDGVEYVVLPTKGQWQNYMQFGQYYTIRVASYGAATDAWDNSNTYFSIREGAIVKDLGGLLWATDNGSTWSKLNGSPTGGSTDEAGVRFNNKYWILGGWDGRARSEVYASADGVGWAPVGNMPAPRAGHKVVVFNNKMWVLGGSADGNDQSRENNVWSSTDGKNWTISNAPWTGRLSHAAAVFDGKIWVAGGWAGFSSVPSEYPNSTEVWSSSDGINWNKVAVNVPLSSRMNFPLLVMNGKLWIVGAYTPAGLQPGQPNFADVWSSSDGIHWTQVSPSSPWVGRWNYSSFVLDNKIFIVGGWNGSVTLRDVWSTSDGVNWTQVTSSLPFETDRMLSISQ